jgi:predicted nucleic-acid-binding protein
MYLPEKCESMEAEFNDIGEALLHRARQAERSPREVLSELFPYIFEASERMSTRAIADWLKNEHDVQISQPTIVRALRNPDKHWQDFADFIEPAARKVESAVDAGIEDFLFDKRIFDHVLEKAAPRASSTERVVLEWDKLNEAADFMRRKWFSLDEELRENCRRFFNNQEESEDGK